MRKLLVFILLLFSIPSLAQQVEKDSTDFEYSFQPKRLILPAAMIGVSAWAIDNGFLVKEKSRFQDKMQDLSGGHTTKIDDYLRYVPTAVSLVMPYLGTPTKLSQEDRWLVRINSYAIMFAMTYGTKHLVNEKRPDGSDEESFPSGHCANTFMTAENIRIEYGGWYGVAAYSFATGIGILRMYNNKHWLNDVVAGAGVGILSARLGYWLLPLEHKVLGIDKKKDNTMVVAIPYYNPSGNAIGATMAINF